MFLFQFVKKIIETVTEIYEILLIWWVDPQYPWSQGIGSPIWGSSMTRVKKMIEDRCEPIHFEIVGCTELLKGQVPKANVTLSALGCGKL